MCVLNFDSFVVAVVVQISFSCHFFYPKKKKKKKTKSNKQKVLERKRCKVSVDTSTGKLYNIFKYICYALM